MTGIKICPKCGHEQDGMQSGTFVIDCEVCSGEKTPLYVIQRKSGMGTRPYYCYSDQQVQSLMGLFKNDMNSVKLELINWSDKMLLETWSISA
jgi:hypothetical protein